MTDQKTREITRDENTAVGTARAEDPTPADQASTTTDTPVKEEPANDKARAAGIADDATTKLESDETQQVTGFAPFRYWLIREIKRCPLTPTLRHAGLLMEVEDITFDGQIRLKHGEGFNLVPFDERYIPDLLKQVLGE